MSRFDQIFTIGDSFMRELTVTMFMYLRGDLVNGGRIATGEGEREDPACQCEGLFGNAFLCANGIVADSDRVWNEDPTSFVCPRDMAKLQYQLGPGFPPESNAMAELLSLVQNKDTPNGRTVFIFGHGVWNDFEPAKTKRWIEQFDNAFLAEMPAFFADGILGTARFPRLFISPHAQSFQKMDMFHLGQNNFKAVRHAQEVMPWVRSRGYDVLGTYNLTVQSSSRDGTHTSLGSNLVKAMMVFNWLDKL